jgi:hypothetical protein
MASLSNALSLLNPRRYLRFLPPLLAVVFLAGVTELPYAHGRRAARAGHHYDGLIAYSDDIHAYLSFVRQSADGRFLFENRYAPHTQRPVFFNLEWLLVGKAMRWLGDPAILTAWRLSGVILLVFGFWTLSSLLPRYEARLIALVLFGLGGGFGWLAEGVRALAPEPDGVLAFLQMDQGGFGLHPFVQMLQNPHFAVPHGLVLFALAFLVTGETTGRTSPYALAGVMALLAGLSRPYELLAFTLVLPALHLVSPTVLDRRRLGQRALVLLILAPAWIPVFVIWTEPSYRPFAQQGRMPVVSLPAHLLGLGVSLILIATRVVRDRGLPLRTPAERVLVLWAAAIFLLVHANRFMTALVFSPQLMITSMGPLVLLAMPVIARDDGPRGGRRFWLPVGILALALPSSAIVLSKRYRDAAQPYFLFSEGERQAWEWLAAKTRPSDLIMVTAESGNRLPRHVSAHVFAGQWAMTPDSGRRKAEAEAFFLGRLAPGEAEAFLRAWGIDWIWVGPAERSMGGSAQGGFAPGCDEAYRLRGVRIFRCQRGSEPKMGLPSATP